MNFVDFLPINVSILLHRINIGPINLPHRFVVDGEQLFRDSLRDRVQTGTAATSEDDSFHRTCVFRYEYRVPFP